MNRLAVLTLFFCCVSPLRAQEKALRAMTVDDGLNAVEIGDVSIAPDAGRVFFSKSELNWEKNKREKTYWMAPADGGEAIQFIGEAGGSQFQFSPDGRFLAFRRPVDKKNQIFVMPTSGGEAQQLTKHDTAVDGFRWSPDSDRIFFVADDFAGKKAEKQKKDGDDAYYVDEGPNGQRQASWTNLWVIARRGGSEEVLTKEEFRIDDFDVSPDGSRVALTARRENRRNQENLSEIYLFDLAEKTLTRLTENRAPEASPKWSPDGSQLIFEAASDKEWDLRGGKLWLIRPDGGAARLVSGAFDGNIRDFIWSIDGKEILFSGQWKTDQNLYRLDLASGEVRDVSRETGSIEDVSFSSGGAAVAFTKTDFRTPPDLFVSSMTDYKPIRITDSNPWIGKEIQLADSQVIRWKSRDGLEIEGILTLPADYQPGTRLPLILHIHGGPAGSFRNSFSPSFHIWAGLGYASLAPNVRGSSGYGDDLLRGNMRDIGGGDYEDLMAGVDEVVAKGWVDPDRMGVRGWSYGGILGSWTITKTDRFKAASLGAMVSDWTSEYGPGFNYDVRLWYIGGTPWENPEEYRRKSSLTHVANVKTPTLIMHGLEDTTDTEAQSMNFFAALKDQGKPVRYIRFPREPHGFREPRHRRTRDIEEIRWMQKYVLGLDWQPWERPENEKDHPETTDADPAP